MHKWASEYRPGEPSRCTTRGKRVKEINAKGQRTRGEEPPRARIREKGAVRGREGERDSRGRSAESGRTAPGRKERTGKKRQGKPEKTSNDSKKLLLTIFDFLVRRNRSWKALYATAGVATPPAFTAELATYSSNLRQLSVFFLSAATFRPPCFVAPSYLVFVPFAAQSLKLSFRAPFPYFSFNPVAV